MLAFASLLSTGLALNVARGGTRCAAPTMTTLYDMPVSNHGARVRMLLYKLGLEDAVQVRVPQRRAS